VKRAVVKKLIRRLSLERIAKLYVQPLKSFDSFLQSGSGANHIQQQAAGAEEPLSLDSLLIEDEAFEEGPLKAAKTVNSVPTSPPPASVEGLAKPIVAADGEKERHSSGDSDDSVAIVKEADEKASQREESVILSDGSVLKGILKGSVKTRWSSESSEDTFNEECDEEEEKKSVHFNETVERRIFRPNSSIFGLTAKNQKKREQKRKRAERRASESSDGEGGKSPDVTRANKKGQHESDDEEDKELDSQDDSGVASSVDVDEGGVPAGTAAAKAAIDASTKAGKAKRARKRKQNKQAAAAKQQMAMEAANDLIFDLDI